MDSVEGNGGINETLGVIKSLVEMAKEICLTETFDWWKYEFCYRLEVTQYYTVNGKFVGDVISLGWYSSDFNWSADGVICEIKIGSLIKSDTTGKSVGSINNLTDKFSSLLQEVFSQKNATQNSLVVPLSPFANDFSPLNSSFHKDRRLNRASAKNDDLVYQPNPSPSIDSTVVCYFDFKLIDFKLAAFILYIFMLLIPVFTIQYACVAFSLSGPHREKA